MIVAEEVGVQCVSSVRTGMSAFEVPHIYTVQTILVTAMYEWGHGEVHRAWMYSGKRVGLLIEMQIRG